MINGFTSLTTTELQELHAALDTGRVSAPYTSLALQRILSPSAARACANVMTGLNTLGMSTAAMAAMVDLLLADRRSHQLADDLIDLVTSGPDAASMNRDTAVVVRDLFAYAEESVWIAGYAVHKGKRLFDALAKRMTERPDLKVVMVLDIRRGPADTTASHGLVRAFKQRFTERDWPSSSRLPAMYYFPKSLEPEARSRAALHAKCVVVDGKACFVSSANFTEAAQNKNIEVGLLVRSAVVATRLQKHLESLVEGAILQPV